MTVYVDTLIKHNLTGKPAMVQRTFRDGACHMFSDATDPAVARAELNAVADAIGMRRAWIQEDNKDLIHYDLNLKRRVTAVARGLAIECDKYKTVEVMRANRAARIERLAKAQA